MNILTLFHRHRQLLLLTLLLILVWGLSAFFSLPRLEDPEIRQRVSTVTTLFPGATAERVEALVTKPIEEKLSEIEEIDILASRSEAGISLITIYLYEEVNEVDKIWIRVRSELDDVERQLPSGTEPPQYKDLAVTANSLIVGLIWEEDIPVNYALLRRQAAALGDKIRALSGTAEVDLFGEPIEEVRVEVFPTALAKLGLTVEALSQQIQASDAKISAGQLYNLENNLLLELSGELDSLERIRNIPVQVNLNGEVTRLGDIANVRKDIADPSTSLAFVSGKPAVVVSAKVASGMSIDVWTKSAKGLLLDFQAHLSNSIQIKTILDQSHYVNIRIQGVLQELIASSVLALLVILLLMGWRSALAVSITLPFSILLVFGGMKVLGVPLHQISMTGIVIAIGLLVDNTICIADEIQSRLAQEMSMTAAITGSLRLMGLPLLGSTITTVFGFLPIALSPGNTGEFTGSIGITTSLGLISSLFVSLTILPALLKWLHQWGRNLRTPAWMQEGLSYSKLTNFYRWTLQKAFSKPWLTISLSLIVPVMGFTLATQLQLQLFPPAGRDQFYIEFELPNQATLSQTQTQVLQARELILKHPEVVDVYWFVGESAPIFYYNVIGRRENADNYAQGLVQVRRNVQTRPIVQTLQMELDEAFPTAQVLVRQIEQGPPFDAPVEVRLYGPELATLQQLGNQIRAEMAKIQDVLHTRTSLTSVAFRLQIQINEEQARVVGLDRAEIARQLNAATEGEIGGSILEGTEELPVRVRLSNANRANLEQINSLDLIPSNQVTNNQQTIPFSSIGKIQLVSEQSVIQRRNRQRVNVVQSFLTASALPFSVQSKLTQRLSDSKFTLPPGYTFEFGGETEKRNTAISKLLSILGIFAVLMSATLILTFGSFALAGSIGAIALLSVGLGLLILRLSGYPFGFMAILGVVGLIGIAINEATVVITALQADSRARMGNIKSVQEVVVHSTRHMLTTTITDAIGYAPLLLDPTGFWNPLAIVISGGLTGVSILSLYFVPSVYLLLRRKDQV